jgi:serine/threonine-protein kinase
VIGDVIGNFQLLSRLGRGGMGEVFLAEHTGIQTRVAVKVLHPEISRDHDHVQRFFNEAKIVGRIKHAGIVKIFDVGFHDEHAYLIMELLEGESLAKRLERVGRLPASPLSDIGRQIASVLDATHRAGITHRDLKPDNIFLVTDEERASGERVKILDFGIAKLTGTLAGSAPKTHGTMGTPTYMAPEQWGDSAKVDWRADVYSLGCVAFEMACGRPPFIAHNIAEAYTKHLTEPPPPVAGFAPDMPPAFDLLIAHLLAKKPDDRPPSMAAIAQMFEALGQGAERLSETMQRMPSASSSFLQSTAIPAVAATLADPASGPVRASARPSTDLVAPVLPRTTLTDSSGEITGTKNRPPIAVVALAATAVVAAIGAIAVIVVTKDKGTPPAAPVAPAAIDASVTIGSAVKPPTTGSANAIIVGSGSSSTSDTGSGSAAIARPDIKADIKPDTGHKPDKPKGPTIGDCASYKGDYAAAGRTNDWSCVRTMLKPRLDTNAISTGEARYLKSACVGLGDKACVDRAVAKLEPKPVTPGTGSGSATAPPPPPPKTVDTDNDGVPDSEDRCPRDPGPAATHGCPDRDGDGLADMDDDCPGQPGPASNRGCPKPEDKPPEKPPPPKGSDSALDGRT